MKWLVEIGYEEACGAEFNETVWRALRTVVVDLPQDAIDDFRKKAAGIVAAHACGPDGEEIEAEIFAHAFELDKVLDNYRAAGEGLLKAIRDEDAQEPEE